MPNILMVYILPYAPVLQNGATSVGFNICLNTVNGNLGCPLALPARRLGAPVTG